MLKGEAEEAIEVVRPYRVRVVAEGGYSRMDLLGPFLVRLDVW